MIRFRLDVDHRAFLPPFVPGRTDLVALARPNTPLACALVGIEVMLENRNTMGVPCAEMVLRPTNYHVVTQPGNQFVVSPLDMLVSETDISPQYPEPFNLGAAVEVGLDRPIASSLAGFWNIRGQTVTIYELWRRRNALVMGQISDEVEPDSWLETATGRFLAEPGSYIIQEFTGRGVRVVPPLYMGREFAAVRRMDGLVVEEFLQTQST